MNNHNKLRFKCILKNNKRDLFIIFPWMNQKILSNQIFKKKSKNKKIEIDEKKNNFPTS